MISGSDFSQTDGPVLHFYSLFRALDKIRPGIKAYAHFRTNTPDFSGIHYLPASLPGMLASLEFQIRSGWKIIMTCLTRKTNCLYIRSHYMMFMPWMLSWLFRIPMITEFNGIIDEYKRPKWILAFGKIVEKFLARKSAAVICITQEVKEWMIKHYSLKPDNIFVISNAADPGRFDAEYRMEMRTPYQLDLKQFIVTFVGSLTWWQGVSFFIEAIPELEKKIPDLKVLIIGDGGEYPHLAVLTKQLHLESRVYFAGKVSSHEAARYMQISDVLILPKVPITCSPLKLYEYMAAGRPVVASDLPGFEIVQESGCGILVPPKNPAAIAEAVLKLHDLTQDERQKMGMRGRNKIIKDHTWDAVAIKTLKIIEEKLKTEN